MLFSSPIFLFLFLPLTIIIYRLVPKKLKNLLLLLASLFFYTWGEKELIVIILASTLIDFISGQIIDNGQRKTGLFLSLVFNLGLLLYFKYANFVFSNLADLLNTLQVPVNFGSTFSNIALPLGISFYTFQTMSYTIDVYRGQVKAQRNLINFATYVCFFPQLIAGPIVRYKDIQAELTNRKTTSNLFASGVERFIIGLAKKMIIANNCAFLADGVFNLPSDERSALIAWLGILAYSFQIYFDFSGYSDMAIGLGKMFGFNFPENFNFPYISKSIQEFWRRWHITLSSWFKDYLYISLGGNRKGKMFTYLNLFIVFLLTGLWHGANWTFIVWGLIHGGFMIIERIGFKDRLQKLPNVISHLYTLLVVGLSWVFFRSDTIQDSINYLGNLFSLKNETNIDFLNFYLTKEVLFVLVLAVTFSTPLVDSTKKGLKRLGIFPKSNESIHTVKFVCLIALFIISCFYVATDSYNPFIYFRF
ncbi:membrane-bound O-acyltransferase family protein [Mangrovimonas sp. DI 80]|nr:membrane-bound O-acyltransferase family protein [Mangrovimonas sp. DI 80]